MQRVGKTTIVDKIMGKAPSPLPRDFTEGKDTEGKDTEAAVTDEEVLAEELKSNIDYLIMAWKKGDKSRIMFRVGQISRQFVELGRMCASFPEAKIAEPNKGIIV